MENYDELILESYPDAVQAKIEIRNRQRVANTPSYINGHVRNLVFEDLKLWRVGSIKVSFKGGDTVLHQKIADTASIWGQFGNLTFDFGFDSNTNSFRKWHENDTSEIRVGFDYNGYWSLVGTDSTDDKIVNPGDITLNLSKFNIRLPENWEGIVLHEFGHALGFHHEHQTPDIECGFDWKKVYDNLGGHPNYWPKNKVDHNLKQLQNGGLTNSAHDSNSIMHYSFPSWMFIKNENSPCFTEENNNLSLTDQEMMGRAYPFDNEVIAAIDTYRVNNLGSIIAMPNITNNIQKFHIKHLEYYKQIQ